MILTKLQEALADIPAQRLALDEVEVQLRAMIAKLTGVSSIVVPMRENSIRRESSTALAVPTGIVDVSTPKDKIEEVAEILGMVGRPTHITGICKILSESKGVEILRTSIEPGINRHIAKTKNPKLARFAPSTYGLPQWRIDQGQTHAQIAS